MIKKKYRPAFAHFGACSQLAYCGEYTQDTFTSHHDRPNLQGGSE